MSETLNEMAKGPEDARTPRVYVASLSDYNNGWSLGTWINAAQEPEAIHKEIRAMLALSPEPVAEEWVIQDSKGFGSWRPRKHESIETLSFVANLIVEYGEVFGGLVNHCGNLTAAMRYMRKGHRGEWQSLQDYVRSFLHDVYGNEIGKLPDILRHHLDFRGITREFERSGAVFTIDVGHAVHVFESSV
jgi:antirestriction protein